MCGIFGMFAVDAARPVNVEVLDEMGRSLRHRGPDSTGIHTSGGLGIGMRRLSIIDLATGDQPMTNEDGTVWVVFNGEIYNYRDLAGELRGGGHEFATKSDTEVLVHLYEEYGERCVERLRGMFAFAIWDVSRRILFLGRDRLGIKPLYYADTPQGFVFGSELKAVAASPWISRSVDQQAVTAYLRYGYVPDPVSILKNVAKLPPGHTLTVSAGRAAPSRRYWGPASYFRESATRHPEEAAEALWAHMRDAVRVHLVSDVPVGAFLSGGMDSSTVVALMALEAGAPIKTFSVGFREPEYNELPYARRVAERFGTDHHEIVVEPADLDVLESVLDAVDEPFADASSIPTYVLSRLARRHVKVVLSGDGGDELFAGYDRYIVDHRLRYLGILGDHGLGRPLERISAALPEGTPGKNYLHNLSLPRMQRYLDAISTFPPRAMRHLFGVEANLDGASIFDAALRASAGLDPLSRLQAFDLETYLPGDILTKLDRMSMAHSLEARVPLLDHPLVEFACRLPADLRLHAGESKFLLKQVMRHRLPVEPLTRRKQGFGVPLEAWFTRDLPSFFQERLGDGSRLSEVGIDDAAVRRLIGRFASQHRQDHCRQLWSLVVLQRALQRMAKTPAR